LAPASLAARPAPPAPPRRRSRAKPKPPRPRIVVISDLRALGGLLYEQAVLDATATPQVSLVTWANRLAMELDVEGVGSPADYRELLWAVVKVGRRAAADPTRPMVAIPPAP
jgi:hypothetical protein